MGVGLVGAVCSRAILDTNIANFRQIELSQEAADDVMAVESTRRTIESLVERLSSVGTQITEAATRFSVNAGRWSICVVRRQGFEPRTR
jgi:hypothetical protein